MTIPDPMAFEEACDEIKRINCNLLWSAIALAEAEGIPANEVGKRLAAAVVDALHIAVGKQS